MYQHADPSELFDSLKGGDSKAFDQIYEQHADRLFRFVYSRIKEKETTEEILQEIFVSLWSNREKIVIFSSLESYLFGAAKHKILSYIRSVKVRRKYADHFAKFLSNQIDNSLEDYIALEDVQWFIDQKVAELPEKCRTVFKMSRMDHLSIPEIAKQMNISTRSVENYISKALRHLRIGLGNNITPPTH